MIQDNEIVLDLLKKMAVENADRNQYLKRQLFFTRIFAGACCILTITVILVLIRVVPPMLIMMDQGSRMLTVMDQTLEDVQELFEEDGLVGQSSEALRQATEKISRMDIDSLNDAIRDLGDVVEPLAEFSTGFTEKIFSGR